MNDMPTPDLFTESRFVSHDGGMGWRERIAEVRRQRGWTQEVLAKHAGFGQSTVARWEAGPNRPTVEQFAQLAAALGVTLSELYGETAESVYSRPSPDERAILAVVRGQGLSLEDAVRRLSRPLVIQGEPLTEPVDVTHRMPEEPGEPIRRRRDRIG